MADRSTPARRSSARRRPADLARGGHGHIDSADPRRRMAMLLALLLVGIFGLGTRLVELQIRQGPALAAAAVSQQVQQVSIPATRGLIVDSQGQVLAGNVPTYDVFAAPKQIPATQRVRDAARLAPVLNLPANQILQLLSKPLDFEYLAKGQPARVDTQLQQLDLTGIGAIQGETRSYGPGPVPNTSLAANVLGFVNANGQGQYGLEGYYNSVLAGHPGTESVIQDLQGNPVVLSSAPQQPAVNGRNLQTSLNATIQATLEKDLAAEVQKVNASSGTMIVMNVHTGGIVAWADYPSYNANNYASEPVKLFTDAGVASLYEPGSVGKVLTFAGALNRHVITPTQTFDETGQVTVQGWTIRDWDLKAHGVISMNWVLEDSLNVGAVHIQQWEGARPFYQNMQAFGIGHPTGIDLAGASNQPLPAFSQLQPIQLATASFGQGYVTTPIQMLAAVNAVANGGVWVQPHVVSAITGGGQPTITIKPKTRRVISAATAQTLTQMMVGVVDVTGGSGYAARIWPAWKGEIAGKTGTSSVSNGHGVYGNNTIDSFTEFFPASNPQFSMLCIIRDPQVPPAQREGAYDAAPTSKPVTQQLINTFKLQP
ncbi:MAG: peptidoglycan D,D-transpeptidase FtsI family protein [Candidatus Dormibacteria bacterium]